MAKYTRNSNLKATINGMPKSAEHLKASKNIPQYDTTNRQGHGAYKLEDRLRLVSMLNTLKMENQFYRSENDTMRELQSLVETLGLNDPKWVCKAIIWSRCKGEGMRSINHLAAVLIAPFISGQEYAKRFYSLWNKKDQKGGCIFRPDDMEQIKTIYDSINSGHLSNAMKKGFAAALETMDTYTLLKYKEKLVDVINLVHPNVGNSKATVKYNDELVKTIDAIMRGYNVSADTHEVAQSEAGQIVAQAVKDGKINKSQAEVILKEAKADNWKTLMEDGKLAINAAIKNMRNILSVSTDDKTINMLCDLVSDTRKIREGKVMPYQIDIAYEELLASDNDSANTRKVINALEDGMEKSVSNLTEMLPGRNLVVVDCSGSMGGYGLAMPTTSTKNQHTSYRGVRGRRASSCAKKAALVSAMILKATNADFIHFGGSAHKVNYNPKSSLFDLAKSIERHNDGWTNLASVFELLTREKKVYDRIIILSDNEVNGRCVGKAYEQYVRDVANPYIYAVDLASYGTAPIKSDKVSYFFGYGYAMFDAIAQNEFNPNSVMDEIDAIEL